MIITIDGPVASGKSTVAKTLAQKLGYHFLNTGLMYRAVAFLLMKKFNYDEKNLLCPTRKAVEVCLDVDKFIYFADGKGASIFYDGVDITSFLKTPEMDRASSVLSACISVRKILLTLQKKLAKDINIVADGRDTGSVVFPDAKYKFYLTASLEERARRWRLAEALKGVLIAEDEAKKLIKERDQRDMKRDIAPLIVPEGAITIDNTGLTEEETLQKFLSFIK
ncbi:MAG: Cytidylate kinase [candidate division TM6 bacterium GW2011_GWF2_32_72]|nr:MAG: Cytidylate kinase [candidate division TM6 bacterium GW2011_GWF2_32_72]